VFTYTAETNLWIVRIKSSMAKNTLLVLSYMYSCQRIWAKETEVMLSDSFLIGCTSDLSIHY